jgi:hypothetical protein
MLVMARLIKVLMHGPAFMIDAGFMFFTRFDVDMADGANASDRPQIVTISRH